MTGAGLTIDEVFSSDNCAWEGVTISTAAKKTIKGILNIAFILLKVIIFPLLSRALPDTSNADAASLNLDASQSEGLLGRRLEPGAPIR